MTLDGLFGVEVEVVRQLEFTHHVNIAPKGKASNVRERHNQVELSDKATLST